MMRDFNQWLGDLTESLQEKEADHESCDGEEYELDRVRAQWHADRKAHTGSDPAEIHGMWARPEPCDVCGSAEEICECEEEDDERCTDQEFHEYLQHINRAAAARDYRQDLKKQAAERVKAVKGAHSHNINPGVGGPHSHSLDALAYGMKLHENFEKDLREGLLAPLPDVKQAVFQYSIGSHTVENVTKPWDDCTFDEETLHRIGEDLHREILDAQLARMRQCLQVPQEYMRETHDDLGTMSIAQARAIDPAVDPVGAQLDAQLRAMRAAKGHDETATEYRQRHYEALEGRNKTATEVMSCQREMDRRIRQAYHELQAYTQRFVRDMLRRAEREGGDS